MSACAAAGAGFLLAVLWFDLMFDVQAAGHRGRALPQQTLDSIGGYYARVTTAARPMNRLVALVMAGTLAALIAEVVQGKVAAWVAWSSLAFALGPMLLAGTRIVPRAVRLGAGWLGGERESQLAESRMATFGDPAIQPTDAVVQSELARSILREHIACAVGIAIVLILQLAVA